MTCAATENLRPALDLGYTQSRELQMGGGAVERFYRVTFTDEPSFRLWTERVVEFTALVRDIIADRIDLRPVIFVPLRPVSGEPLYAYVSVGARGLATRISDGAKVEPSPVNAADLPRGLTMLFGDGADAAEYESHQE
jgi:hypothetical protein